MCGCAKNSYLHYTSLQRTKLLFNQNISFTKATIKKLNFSLTRHNSFKTFKIMTYRFNIRHSMVERFFFKRLKLTAQQLAKCQHCCVISLKSSFCFVFRFKRRYYTGYFNLFVITIKMKSYKLVTSTKVFSIYQDNMSFLSSHTRQSFIMNYATVTNVFFFSSTRHFHRRC